MSLVMAVVALLLAVAPAAQAAKTVDRFIGGPGASGAGALGGLFNGPRDIAVNETGAGAADPGDVYVSDDSNHRIEVFSAAGVFKFAIGRDVIAAGAAGDLGDAFEKCAIAASCQGGSSGTSAEAPAGEFDNPQGIAVSQATGDLYVRDRDHRRVQQFDAAGGFIRAWGFGVATGAAAFEICTSGCLPGLAGNGVGQFGSSSTGSTGIAIAPPGAPNAGDVFVVDPASTGRRVLRFAADGSSPAAFGSSSNFGSNQPIHVAVDSRGVVYASDSNSSGQIDRYDFAGAHGAPGFLASIPAPPLLAGASEGLEVDPDSDGAGADEDVLYVLRNPSSGNTVVQQLGPVNDPGLPAAPAGVDDTHGATAFGTSSTSGLGVNPAGSGSLLVTIATGNACGGACHGYLVLDDDGASAVVGATVQPPVNVTATTADLEGTVDTADGLVRYHFEYSTDGVAYQSTPTVTIPGAGAQAVTEAVTGLQPNTLTRVRLVVEKILGPSTVVSDTAGDITFATAAAAPAATTLPVGPRTDTTAELRGEVDPNGSATTYWFEYGGTSYGTRIPLTPAPAGSGNEPLPVTQQIAGLAPDTTYHYRVVADGFGPPVVGGDRTFVTKPPPGPPPGPLPRAYELVSPADKIGGIGVGKWSDPIGDVANMGFAAYTDERFAASGNGGSLLLDSAQGYANDWALAERIDTVSGWRSRSPLTHAELKSPFAKFIDPWIASDDLSKISWSTNSDLLRFFPETVAWPTMNPVFLSDWAGRWEIFGPKNLSQFTPVSPASMELCEVAFSGDASTVACGTALTPASTSALHGLGGAGDPTVDLVSGRSVYLADSSGPLADNIPDTPDRTLVNVCADGTDIPSVGGSGNLETQPCPPPLPGRDAQMVSSRGASLTPSTSGDADVATTLKNVISEDGSRVFFISPDPEATGMNGGDVSCSGAGAATLCAPQLYVRERNPDGSVTTRWISKAEPSLLGAQDASLASQVLFEGATPDGDKVFFRTPAPLTTDDPNGGCGAPCVTGTPNPNSWDLYAYDLPDGPDGDPATTDGDPAGGTLTRITAGPSSNGDCNGLQDSSFGQAILRFVSDDGSRLYFVCAAPLADVPAAQDGTITTPAGTQTTANATNLYVFDANRPPAERWHFVARIPRAVGSDIAPCASTSAPLGNQLFAGFTFSLTGRSNCFRGTADGAFVTFWTAGRLTADDPDANTADIYAYDAESDDLIRITAPQGGVGGSYPCGTQGFAATLQCNGDSGSEFGARVAKPILGVATHPLVSSDKIAFFQSRSRLVSEDTDDAYDVYQWRNGKLSMLSTGSGPVNAFIRGNDRSGRNVFFATKASLTWQDFDAVNDIYTARIDGGIAQPTPPVICAVLAGECHQGAGGQADRPVVDTAAQGEGNVTPPGRQVLRLGGLSRAQRSAAARSGVIPVRVGASSSGTLRLVAKARLGRRIRTVARGRGRLDGGGTATLRLRLSPAAKKRLRRGRVLKVTLTLRSEGARSRTLGLALKRSPK